jgi:hypothetical protein
MRLITLRRRIYEVCWPDSIDGRALKLELVVVEELLKMVVVELEGLVVVVVV